MYEDIEEENEPEPNVFQIQLNTEKTFKNDGVIGQDSKHVERRVN